MKSLFLISFLSLFFFISCADMVFNANNTYTEVTTFIPLSVGNSWTFRIIEYDSLHNFISENYETHIISGDTLVNGVKYYYYNKGEGYYCNMSSGFYYFSPDFFYAILIYSTKAMQGEIRDDWHVSIHARDTTITVPNGTFNCTVFYDHVNLTYDAVVPNIGMIKQDTYKRNSSGKLFLSSVNEMDSYNVSN